MRLKNLVINDSNGTIQVDPTINFHDLLNSHSAYDKNAGTLIFYFVDFSLFIHSLHLTFSGMERLSIGLGYELISTF